ncbi:MAG: response regulator transcription factor [Cyclobacteriaceae bacterium]
MEPANILLAEDDENLGFVITDQLSELGFRVTHAVDGAQGWRKFESGNFDLCLIDVMMPGLDGFSLAKKIRSSDEFVPIIFLTAKSLEEDRLNGFEIGGDDYVTKPFSMTELAYRIKVFLRRRSSGTSQEEAVSFSLGSFVFDYQSLTLKSELDSANLTQIEADVLKMLAENKGALVKREDILVKIWGENDYFKGRSLDVFISRLRKYLKLDANLEIRNHHGVGFTLFDHNLPG